MADSRESPLPTPAPDPSLQNLQARVRERLDRAGRAFDRRAAASRPPRRRTKLKLLQETVPEGTGDLQHLRERACLRAVFHELGDAHRLYRRRTGNSLSPALRAATDAFKLEPSVLSLVPVAAFLEEMGILRW